MQPSEFGKFKEGVQAVMSFYRQEVSDFALDVWWSALKVYDLTAISQAFSRHVTNPDTGQFPPKPADLVRMLQGSTQDSALRAWAMVDKAVRQIGSYESVVFDDPLVHRVIYDMGGWMMFGTKTEADWPFLAKEFENRYRGFKARSETPDYPRVLIGVAEAHNTKAGQNVAPPVLIGDKAKAKLVLEGGAANGSLLTFTRADEALAKSAGLLGRAA